VHIDDSINHSFTADAIARHNRTLCEAQLAQHEADVAEQRRMHTDRRLINTLRLSAVRHANQDQLEQMSEQNQARMMAMLSKGAQTQSEHEKWMLKVKAQAQMKLTNMRSKYEAQLGAMRQKLDEEHRRERERNMASLQIARQSQLNDIQEQYQEYLSTLRPNKGHLATDRTDGMHLEHQHLRHDRHKEEPVNLQSPVIEQKEPETLDNSERCAKSQKDEDEKELAAAHARLKGHSDVMLTQQMEHIELCQAEIEKREEIEVDPLLLLGSEDADVSPADLDHEIGLLREVLEKIHTEQNEHRQRVLHRVCEIGKIEEELSAAHNKVLDRE